MPIEFGPNILPGEWEGVDPRLRYILEYTSDTLGAPIVIRAGKERRRSGFHPAGKAVDIWIKDENGELVPHGAGGTSSAASAVAGFSDYERFAQVARRVQQTFYPELDKTFRWGGYFGGGPDTYGALDTMQFDLGGSDRLGMAGGSWEKGLNDSTRNAWAKAGYSIGSGGGSNMAIGNKNPLIQGIHYVAQELGVDPVDIATIIGYETIGSYDPEQPGPTTKQYGKHRGLIQWGEPQAEKYLNNDFSIPSQMRGIVKYMRDAGVRPGMGILDLYSAVNAGRVGRENWSDAQNGGAPGTVKDKVEQQMGEYRRKAYAMLGGTYQPTMRGDSGGDSLSGTPPQITVTPRTKPEMRDETTGFTRTQALSALEGNSPAAAAVAAQYDFKNAPRSSDGRKLAMTALSATGEEETPTPAPKPQIQPIPQNNPLRAPAPTPQMPNMSLSRGVDALQNLPQYGQGIGNFLQKLFGGAGAAGGEQNIQDLLINSGAAKDEEEANNLIRGGAYGNFLIDPEAIRQNINPETDDAAVQQSASPEMGGGGMLGSLAGGSGSDNMGGGDGPLGGFDLGSALLAASKAYGDMSGGRPVDVTGVVSNARAFRAKRAAAEAAARQQSLENQRAEERLRIEKARADREAAKFSEEQADRDALTKYYTDLKTMNAPSAPQAQPGALNPDEGVRGPHSNIAAPPPQNGQAAPAAPTSIAPYQVSDQARQALADLDNLARVTRMKPDDLMTQRNRILDNDRLAYDTNLKTVSTNRDLAKDAEQRTLREQENQTARTVLENIIPEMNSPEAQRAAREVLKRDGNITMAMVKDIVGFDPDLGTEYNVAEQAAELRLGMENLPDTAGTKRSQYILDALEEGRSARRTIKTPEDLRKEAMVTVNTDYLKSRNAAADARRTMRPKIQEALRIVNSSNNVSGPLRAISQPLLEAVDDLGFTTRLQNLDITNTAALRALSADMAVAASEQLKGVASESDMQLLRFMAGRIENTEDALRLIYNFRLRAMEQEDAYDQFVSDYYSDHAGDFDPVKDAKKLWSEAVNRGEAWTKPIYFGPATQDQDVFLRSAADPRIIRDGEDIHWDDGTVTKMVPQFRQLVQFELSQQATDR